MQVPSDGPSSEQHPQVLSSICQSFLAHPDAVTCVRFVGEDHLVSSSAGDAVAVWGVTPHASHASIRQASIRQVSPSCTREASLAAGPARSVLGGITNRSTSFPLQQQQPGEGSSDQQPEAPSESAPQRHANPQSGCPLSSEHLNGQGCAAGQQDKHPSTAAQQNGYPLPVAATNLPASGEWNPITSQAASQIQTEQHSAANGRTTAATAAMADRIGLHLQRVTGFSGHVPHSVAWSQGMNMIAYAAGSMLVLEDLTSRRQRWAPMSDFIV